MTIKKIGVVGMGIMGSGIVQVVAQSGFAVVGVELDQGRADKAISKISGGLAKLVEKGKIDAKVKDATLANIRGTTDLAQMGECDLVIDAITENVHNKVELFRKLSKICRPEVVIASNTSSISITNLASVTDRPEKVVGMHFFNPVPVMKLLEIIRARQTSDETYQTAAAVGEKLGKKMVTVQDSPGFIVNRCLIPFLNEAIYTLAEGVGTPQDIDNAIKLGLNHPMGPLELADFVGLDTTLAVLEVFYQEFGDPKYRPCLLLKKYVEAGWLGRKSGRGFYNYS